MSAPKQVESIPTVTKPIDLPQLEERVPRAWAVAATVAGLVAVVTLIVAVVTL